MLYFKKQWLITLIGVCLLFIVKPLLAETTYSPGIQQIMDRKKLVVAMYSEDIPPLFSKDKHGNLVGDDVELAHYLGKNLGVPVEFLRTAKTFDGVIDLVAEGKADIAISALTPNLVRARKVIFTIPYLYSDTVLAYNRLLASKHAVTDPTEYLRVTKNLNIGLLHGSTSTYHEYAHEYVANAVLIEYPDMKTALSAVAKGKIDGFLTNSTNLFYELNREPDMRLYISVNTLKGKKDPFAIAVSLKYPDLVSWLNLALTLRKLKNTNDNEKENTNSIGEQ